MPKSAFSKYKHDVRYHLKGRHKWDKTYALFWLNGNLELLRKYFLASVSSYQAAIFVNEKRKRDVEQ